MRRHSKGSQPSSSTCRKLVLAAGTAGISLVEQNVERALSISDRAYIMDHGVIVHDDTAASLLADKTIRDRYCAV